MIDNGMPYVNGITGQWPFFFRAGVWGAPHNVFFDVDAAREQTEEGGSLAAYADRAGEPRDREVPAAEVAAGGRGEPRRVGAGPQHPGPPRPVGRPARGHLLARPAGQRPAPRPRVRARVVAIDEKRPAPALCVETGEVSVMP